jgi:hypothetical protein
LLRSLPLRISDFPNLKGKLVSNPFETPEWAVLKEWSQAIVSLDPKDPRSVLKLRGAYKKMTELVEAADQSDDAIERAVLIQVVKDAAQIGMVIDQDNDGQVIIVTGLAYPSDDDLPTGTYDELVIFELDEDEDEDEDEDG